MLEIAKKKDVNKETIALATDSIYCSSIFKIYFTPSIFFKRNGLKLFTYYFVFSIK